MTTPDKTPLRGEIWEIRFDPSEGDEIKKIRPAAVINIKNTGRMALMIVVPITGWQPSFIHYFWMVNLKPASINGLTKESAVDAFQIKSLSVNRFLHKLGTLQAQEIKDIVNALTICIGHSELK